MSIRHGFGSRGLEGTPRCGSAYKSVRSDISHIGCSPSSKPSVDSRSWAKEPVSFESRANPHSRAANDSRARRPVEGASEP
jgi:hypothetical protein